MKVSSGFNVTLWNPVSADNPKEGPTLSRIEISKEFTGDSITGESKGEGLFCGMNDPEAGAGYLVNERFEGILDGRSGSFVMQHGGLMGPDIEPHTFGSIVPGSGTGQLKGISGSIEIVRSEGGMHELYVEYNY